MNSTLKIVIVLVVLIIIIKMTGSNRKDHFMSYRGNKSLRYGKKKVNMANMYALDPTGSVSQYDISNQPISKKCSPAQWMSDPELKDNNCEYSNEYVANNYSGMNYKDGSGGVCITPDVAAFYGHRGGNA